jgi:predicted phage baseplate assembly protein
MRPPADPPSRLELSDVIDWSLLIDHARQTDAELARRLIEARNESATGEERMLAELNRDVSRALAAAGALLGRDPVVVTVDGELWEPVDSFALSHSESRHFVVDVDAGRVLFGNGLNGRIPAKDADIRAVWYRTCAGVRGNVAANHPWRAADGWPAGVTLQNIAAASGGAEPETLDALELRAQASLRRPNRGVTSRDLERLAIETPVVHVARARAVVNWPQPEMITVVVLPKGRPGRVRPRADVSAAFLEQVRRHLERHRLLCDQLRVIAPVFVEVSVKASLRLVKGASPASVIARASEALDRFFRGELDLSRDTRVPSLPPLVSPCPTRWPFGRAVRVSEVYAALESVVGVDTVWGLELQGRIGTVAVPRDRANGIPLPSIGLVLSGTHDLVVEEPRRSSP